MSYDPTMTDFDPWEFFVWMATVSKSDEHLTKAEIEAQVDKKLDSYTPEQRQMIDAFRERYMLVERDEKGVTMVLVDGAKRRGLDFDY